MMTSSLAEVQMNLSLLCWIMCTDNYYQISWIPALLHPAILTFTLYNDSPQTGVQVSTSAKV